MKLKSSATSAYPLPAYDHVKLEPKWQKQWAKKKLYKIAELKSADAAKDKFYVLDMFPYPSGEGLHVGHPKGYIATDVVSRMKRMQGKNVLHPMGFDAFGLPAENYAIKMKTNPAVAVAKNVERYKEQLEKFGFDYDWSREINTTDPAYYKWTQWIFLKLLEKGLAFQSHEPIDWCPSCKTGLAKEDIEDGKCERCGTPVEKKLLKQWVLRITDYAERLLVDLDATDYEIPKIVDKANPHRPGKEVVERNVAHAIVFDPKTRKYLIIRNKKFGWDTVVIGGIEHGENAIETARREVREETGYTDIEFKRLLGGLTESHYFTKHKDENRIAYAQAVYFELKSDARAPIAAGENEHDEILWVSEADFVPGKMVNSELPVWLERLNNPAAGSAKPLLDWPTSIKELQRNWIGKSEGAEIEFVLKFGLNKSEEKIKVFTTRPDTLYGVTYVVLAPEHVLVQTLLNSVSNKKEVEQYLAATKLKTEIDRTDAKKEKTGVELKGVQAINPANGEAVSVWVADYVLAEYGTGAVMAVPAHDERDWAFAKKFDLPIKEVIMPVEGEPHLGSEFRKTISAIVYRKSDGKFLALKWKKFNWLSVPIGGIEEGETAEETAEREVFEETGYRAKSIGLLGGRVESHFFAENKNVWRARLDQPVLLEVTDETPSTLNEEEKEKHEPVWLTAKELLVGITHKYNAVGLERFVQKNHAYGGKGKLINSGTFDRMSSVDAGKKIVEQAGGKMVTKYKLRDWVFSRQRYWGEPIPVLHCERCGVVPVPEKDLPVKLPKVKFYEPTGTGESPLAAIDKWVNTKCPKCIAEKKQTKHLIFDFDGVLGDTWNATLETRVAMGLAKDREGAIAHAMEYFNKKPNHTRDRVWLKGELEGQLAWTNEYGKIMLEKEYGLFLKFIKEVKKYKHAKCAVVSTGSILYIEPVLKKVGLKFTHVLAFEHHHSKEEKIEQVCKDWGVSVKDIHYFTDTKADVYELEHFLDRSKIIGCSWGYHGYEALTEVLPEKQILKEFTDIHRVLNLDCVAKRETNTMPQWAGSSWYYLRYMDAQNKKALVAPDAEKYWSPVDLYVGGAEHATRHLIYARFWHKFLYDIGAVSTTEPFKKLQHVGLIMAEDGRKMSKRWGNVVNPDDVIKLYGADTMRVYEMFMGPFDQQIAWNTDSMIGSRRFLERVWKMAGKVGGADSAVGVPAPAGASAAESLVHKTVKKVSADIAEMKFNTAISTLMILLNALDEQGGANGAASVSRAQYETFLKLLAPFAPHMTEELWAHLGHKDSIHLAPWPVCDEAKITEAAQKIGVQVNGKIRAEFEAGAHEHDQALQDRALSLPEVKKWTEGKKVVKVIVVKGKLVNIVVV